MHSVREGFAFLGLRATCRRFRWPKLAEGGPADHGDKFGYALPGGKAQATSLRDPPAIKR